ncbi:MAG: hypothetical protein KAY24_19555 [Candidatus Eisenbacteria sp.]|nr:hypothetical protein [Candidatus Eisenbacteria bacterium]
MSIPEASIQPAVWRTGQCRRHSQKCWSVKRTGRLATTTSTSRPVGSCPRSGAQVLRVCPQRSSST